MEGKSINLLAPFFKPSLFKARFFCRSAAATKKILAALPFPFQCLSPSPFFDPSIMSFDTKYVSLIEKPKLAPDYSIKFFDRRSKKLVFELDILGDSMHETSSSSKPK